MPRINRRSFIKLASKAAALPLLGFPVINNAAKKGRVVIIGGGFGGTVAAKYLRLFEPGIEVVLVEKQARFITCPFSNEVISGERAIDSITFSYEGLIARGIKVLQDEATRIDPEKKIVSTLSGNQLPYDRLIVSAGIDFQWSAIDGYTEDAGQSMPHAWQAGVQTLLLRRQLTAMADGGVVVITAPAAPYRCPPGPYERASLIAHYLKTHKPKSKILILDSKDKFCKQDLFLQGWNQHYPGMITWVSAASGGEVTGVDVGTNTVLTKTERHKAAVANIIPPQRAGRIAHLAGLVDDTGWCPVDQRSFESTIHKHIHVIGDARMEDNMPKSGAAANSQAKVCAAAVVAMMNDRPPPKASLISVCFSLITPRHGISVAGVYDLQDGIIKAIEGAGGLSALDASAWDRKMESTYARSWYRNITAEMFS